MSGQIKLCSNLKNMSGQININAPILQSLVTRINAPVTAADQSRAAMHVLDWLGCAVAGIAQPTAACFRQLADEFSAGESVTHGVMTLSGVRRNWSAALSLNAAVGNLLEMDDLHRTSILHPGPVIVPAAIAVAEQVGASGAELLSALVRGYEATIRIGSALGTSHYRYFHNTSTCGAFGAAAAAASLLQLNSEQTTWALANAGSRTGGLWQMRHEPCETKSLHNVMAAQTGVQAALAARAGIRGPARLLEGPQGLFAAMSDAADPTRVLADLDGAWKIHDVSFKPWPACRHAHPAIDAALAIRSLAVASATSPITANRLDASTIASITLRTYRSAIDFCDCATPTTELQAKFSLQHGVALTLLCGAPTMADFQVDALAVPAVAALRSKVSVIEDVQMTAAFPAHYAASLEVTLQDGRRLSHHQRDAKGDPELPLSNEEIVDKARMLLRAAGVTQPEQLIDATCALPTTQRVRDWTALWSHAWRAAA